MAAIASADAIGPEPLPIDCPVGAYSAVENWGRHGQRAYCAPLLAPADGACREGHRREVVELSIAGIEPSVGGHYGGPGIAPTPENTLARVEGPCDAPGDAEPIGLGPAAPDRIFEGPNLAAIDVGCRRLWTWVEDASVHCPVEVAPPTGAEIAPPPAVEPPTVPATALPPAVAPPAAAPLATEPTSGPALTESAPGAESVSGCSCSHAPAPRSARDALVALAFVLAATAARRASRPPA